MLFLALNICFAIETIENLETSIVQSVKSNNQMIISSHFATDFQFLSCNKQERMDLTSYINSYLEGFNANSYLPTNFEVKNISNTEIHYISKDFTWAGDLRTQKIAKLINGTWKISYAQFIRCKYSNQIENLEESIVQGILQKNPIIIGSYFTEDFEFISCSEEKRMTRIPYIDLYLEGYFADTYRPTEIEKTSINDFEIHYTSKDYTWAGDLRTKKIARLVNQTWLISHAQFIKCNKNITSVPYYGEHHTIIRFPVRDYPITK